VNLLSTLLNSTIILEFVFDIEGFFFLRNPLHSIFYLEDSRNVCIQGGPKVCIQYIVSNI